MSQRSPKSTSGDTAVPILANKKKPKIYWNDDTEAAVREYLSMDFDHLSSKLDSYLKEIEEYGVIDPTIDDGYHAELKSRIEESQTIGTQWEKERIFRKRIRTPLNRLIENIIFSFKLFRYDIDVKTLHNDCMSHVYEKFYKFNPGQNTKSFSYFGTIAKHYLQNKKKDLDILKTINLSYDDHHDEVDSRENYEIDSSKGGDELIELFEHMTVVFENNMNNKALNDNDKKVLDSILELFKSHGSRFQDQEEELNEAEKQIVKEYVLNGSHKKKFAANGRLKSVIERERKIRKKNYPLEDSGYNKGNVFDFISDRSKLSKEDMSKSLTKLRNLYKEKKRAFYNNTEKN